MRFAIRYARSRSALPSALLVVGSFAALGLLADMTTSDLVRKQVAVFAIAAGAAAISVGLAGHDPELDRTAAISWTMVRVLHIVAAMAVASTAFVVWQLTGTAVLSNSTALRNVPGFIGLAALGAVAFGRSLAWCPPVGCALVSAAVAATGNERGSPLVTWPVEPIDDTTSLLIAAALAIGGTALYAGAGPSSLTSAHR